MIPYLPLTLWWAVEKQCDDQSAIESTLVANEALYSRPMFQQHIAPRIVERAGMIGGDRHLVTVAKVFSTIEKLSGETRSAAAKACIAGFERAYAGRSLKGVPDAVLDGMSKLGQPSLALQLRRGDTQAQEQAARLLVDSKADINARLQVARILGEVPGSAALPALFGRVPE